MKWRWCHLLVVIDGVSGLQTRWASLHTPGVEMVLNVRGDVRAGLLRSYATTRKRGCRGLEKVHQVIGNYLREKSHARQSVRGGCDDDSVRM